MDNLCLHSKIYYIWILCGCAWSLKGETSRNLYSAHHLLPHLHPPTQAPHPTHVATHSPTMRAHTHIHTYTPLPLPHTHTHTPKQSSVDQKRTKNFGYLFTNLSTIPTIHICLDYRIFTSFSNPINVWSYAVKWKKNKIANTDANSLSYFCCLQKAISFHGKYDGTSFRMEDVP